MAIDTVRVWTRAQRGVAAAFTARRARFTLELAQLHHAQGMELTFGARYDSEPFTVRAQVSQGDVCAPVTFAGEREAEVPARGSLVSDHIALDGLLAADAPVTITYEVASNGVCASGFDLADYDVLAMQSSALETDAGDVSPQFPHTLLGLCAIDLTGSTLKGCVAFFGDSICELGTYFRPAQQLLAKRGYAALNLGISGNRLLRGLEVVDFSQTDNAKLAPMAKRFPEPIRMTHPETQSYGDAGVKRFARDVLACPGLVQTTLALGANDLYIPGTFCGLIEELASADDLLGGYAALAECLDACESAPRALWLGMTPFETKHGYDEERRSTRMKANERLSAWAQQRHEGCVQFDGCLLNEDGSLVAECYRPDRLHPSAQGGQRMFERIAPFLAS